MALIFLNARIIAYFVCVYIFQVGVIQQLCGRACWWCWAQGLRTGAAVKFNRVELDSINVHLSVTISSAIKNFSAETW